MPLDEHTRAAFLVGPYTRLLAEHEAALADYYDTLANVLETHADFWRTLAKEELAHKQLIVNIDEKLKSGVYRFKRPKFITHGILESLAWIAILKQNVKTKGISMREALKRALELESGMLEANFFAIIDDEDEGMREMLESQKTFTRAHIQRIVLEGKKWKWRILGGKKLFPKTPAPVTALEGAAADALNANAQAFQANLLGLLMAREEATGKLYHAYSLRLKEAAPFWLNLAGEEKQREIMLREVFKMLDTGTIFLKVDPSNRKTLEDMIDYIQRAEENARCGQLSYHQAIFSALKIERSRAESGFRDAVKSDTVKFQIVAKRLADLSKGHIALLQNEMLRTMNLGVKAKENVPLPVP